MLEATHEVVGFGSPLFTHKRRHIASGAMFGLERAAVFVYHQMFYGLHQTLIAVYFGLCIKTLGYHEVVVAFESVSVDARVIISGINEQLLQFDRCFGQVINMD